MKYKIIGDSCCDISKANEVYGKVEIVPLTLSLEGKEYVVQDGDIILFRFNV